MIRLSMIAPSVFKPLLAWTLLISPLPSYVAFAQEPGVAPQQIDYLVLATSKTSTMQNELNEAADSGYQFMGVMGGETAFGGSEVLAIMARLPDGMPRYEYRLLATGRTSTRQEEMQEAGDAGFEYRGQTVFSSTFGGRETVVILERDRQQSQPSLFEYRLLATSQTSTMQDELREAGAAGFAFVGVTVASTRFGGAEVVSILRRPREAQ